MGKLKIAAIGDQFITSAVFETAVRDAIEAECEVVTRDLQWPEVPFFAHDGPAGTEIKEYSGNPKDIEAMLAEAEVLVTHLAPVTAEILEKAPLLKFIGVSRGGPTNINMEAARARNVTVCNVPGRNASAVAEFTVGAILANVRRITVGHAGLSQGIWRGDLYRYDRTGDELSDLTVGLLGYSHIGQRVVRLLKPFGCRILICDPYAKLTVQDAIDGVEQVEIDDLIAQSDILSLHARVTPETTGIISSERIAKMKRGAVLVNSARGELVDQPALCEALLNGHLGGAALDTFEVEPPKNDDELLRLPNVTLTPHIAGASRRVATFAAEQIAEDLARFIKGENLRNPCN
ncbi:2-hydroxyacid dehydrogenase [Celeribacter halophilus]|uniref:D-3-phosphoglycerate dehydrogenase n=1 Tax=Celeribacter halophilus TaxID=576117 RepID=A0A1I3WZX8_9RHOB|nr:2-hydroxyacid dehydrogenase [Celeribacter halophilus]PZX04720.1 D-3-phosphoglycerate dehydrogenase [Celeribacter halophilus]SFK12943.1 D-3-phosphoglycerate dehydrogenase [Celeribacter halophilus]